MKKLLTIVLILMLLLTACGTENKTEEDISDPSKKVSQDEIMNQYNQIIKEDKDAKTLIAFLEENVKVLEQKNVNQVVNKILEAQLKNISDYENRLSEDESLSTLYDYSFDDLLNVQNVSQEELKNFLQEIFDNGYKLSCAEGMYYLEIDYENLNKKFGGYVCPDLGDYLKIMAVESEKPYCEDGALIIGWEELIERTAKTEEYIKKYKESDKAKEMDMLHEDYLAAVLIGLDNTPVFSFESNKIDENVLKVYEKAIEKYSGMELSDILERYVVLIKKNNYENTDEVDKFIKAHTNSVMQ